VRGKTLASISVTNCKAMVFTFCSCLVICIVLCRSDILREFSCMTVTMYFARMLVAEIFSRNVQVTGLKLCSQS
jgi:hypothetical protein